MDNKYKSLGKVAGLGIFLAIFLSVFSLFATKSYAQYSYTSSPFNITTTSANNITSNSAILNGLVNGANLYSTYNISTWFEYGTNTNLGYSSVHINSNSGYANFISTISGLNANTIYYFRAVGQNAQGVIYGSTNSFRTNFANITEVSVDTNDVNTDATITEPASFVTSASVHLNSIIYNKDRNSSSTYFEWGINSANLDNKTTVVQIGALPKVKHVDTLKGLISGTTYYFRAVTETSSSKNNGAILSFATKSNVTEATTNTKDNKENTTTNTNVTETIGSALGVNLGANAIGAGSFLPTNLFGWLILLIFVLTLITLFKHLLGQFSKNKPERVE